MAYSLADVVSNLDSAINAGKTLSLKLCFQERHHLGLCWLLKREDLELKVRLLGPLVADQGGRLMNLLC